MTREEKEYYIALIRLGEPMWYVQILNYIVVNNKKIATYDITKYDMKLPWESPQRQAWALVDRTEETPGGLVVQCDIGSSAYANVLRMLQE